MKGFTFDYLGNNFNDDPLVLKCVERSKQVFGEENFTIYTKEDAIVKEAEEKYKPALDKFLGGEKNVIAWRCDIIRLYILSKSEDTLYVDSDVYLLDDKPPVEKTEAPVFDYGCFDMIYSGFENHEEYFLKVIDTAIESYEKSGKFMSDWFVIKNHKDLFTEKLLMKRIHFMSIFFTDVDSDIAVIFDTKGVKNLKEIKRIIKCAEKLNFKRIKYFFDGDEKDDEEIIEYYDTLFNKKGIISNEWLVEYLTKTTKRFPLKDKKKVRVVEI